MSITYPLDETFRPQSRRRFSLFHPNRFWVVDSGSLDLFAIISANDGLGGPLRHVMRVHPGQAMFGMDNQASSIEMVAVAGPNTHLLSYAVSAEDGPGCGGEDRFLGLLEEWVVALSKATAHSGPPARYWTIQPGQQIAAADSTMCLVPSELVCWIVQSSGQSKFLDEAASIPGDTIFPVTRAGWITLQPDATVYGLDRATIVDRYELLPALAAFHAFALEQLDKRLISADEEERLRLERKDKSDKGALHWALSELSSPLSHRADTMSPTEVLDTPLFRALQRIGSELGVRFKPHPDLLRGKVVSDPVVAIAKASGVRMRRVALKDDWWKGGEYPLLSWREADEGAVALIPKGGRFYVFDPRDNVESPLKSAEPALSQFAYMFYRPLPERPIGVVGIIRFGLKGCGPELSWIFLMGTISGLLAAAVPVATGIIFDSVIPGAQRTELLLVCSVLLFTAVASSACTLIRQRAVLRLEGKMDLSIQAALWDRLLSLPVTFFRDYSSGDLADRSLGIAQIRHLLTSTTLASILSGIFSALNAVLMFYYSTKLAMIGVTLTLAALLFTITAAWFELRFQRRTWALSGLIAGTVLEFITGAAKLRVAGAENRAFVVWVKQFTAQKTSDRSAKKIGASVIVLNESYIMLCFALVFAYYGSGQISTVLSMGHFLAFMAAFTQFLYGVLNFGRSAISALGVVPLYERAAPILTARVEAGDLRSDPGDLIGRIEATHLTFRYRQETPLVIRDVSFRIEAGQFVAFVGPSGCGKSTLLRLLLGFDQPESGAIFYDGKDLNSLDPQGLRRKCGVVLQSSVLTTGTILDNIIGTSGDLGVDEAMEASRMVGLDQDIKRLPMGLYTHIREGGVGFSGGQRQRILIARAIVARPRVLLFDEASSALDNRTQAIVGESLKTLKSTRIVIAHRLSTIVDADQIVVVDRGQIVQQGTYEELLTKGGMFGELAKRQIT